MTVNLKLTKNQLGRNILSTCCNILYPVGPVLVGLHLSPGAKSSGGGVGVVRIMRANSPEWPLVLVGVLASAVVGAWIPVYAVLFGEVLGSLSKAGRAEKAL